MFYLRYLCLFTYNGFQYILSRVFVLFFFVLLPVSLECPFLIAPSVFSKDYLHYLGAVNFNNKYIFLLHYGVKLTARLT